MGNSRFLVCENSIHTYHGMDVRCRWVIDQQMNSIIDAHVGGPDKDAARPAWISLNEDGVRSLSSTFSTAVKETSTEVSALPEWASARFSVPISQH